jgi:murein tripeptide amidase MpaA
MEKTPMLQSALDVDLDKSPTVRAARTDGLPNDQFDGLVPEELHGEFQDSKPATGSAPGVAYRQHLIVPIAGPAPEHTASFLLFEHHPEDARTRLGLFNVQTEHPSVEQAHRAALRAGILKVDALLGPL